MFKLNFLKFKKTEICKKLIIFQAVLIFLNISTPAFSNSIELSPDEIRTINIYEKTNPSIVSIEADMPEGVSTGTGCVVTSDGIILTSMHVVEGAKSIEITIYNGQNYSAKIVAILKNNNDLALLKINPKSPLTPAKFGNSEEIKVGQRVLTIGNPFGFNGTLTTGIVSRIDYERNKIQTDAAINPGCSGGPLITMKGEIVGINQAIYNPDNNRSNIGIGFAVPINNAKDFIQTSLMLKK